MEQVKEFLSLYLKTALKIIGICALLAVTLYFPIKSVLLVVGGVVLFLSITNTATLIYTLLYSFAWLVVVSTLVFMVL